MKSVGDRRDEYVGSLLRAEEAEGVCDADAWDMGCKRETGVGDE